MERNSLNEALKRRASELESKKNSDETSLDDARRVKVLSPTRLVVKRFFRNRLAMVGLIILIVIFMFAFMGPMFYEYGETEVFMHYDYMQRTYATATFNTEFTATQVPDAPELPSDIRRITNSRILTMGENEVDYAVMAHEADETTSHYLLSKIDEHVYAWSLLSDKNDGALILSYVIADSIDSVKNATSATANDGSQIDPDLLATANAKFRTIKGDNTTTEFEHDELTYSIYKTGKLSYSLTLLSTQLTINGQEASQETVETALEAIESELYAWTDASGKSYAMKLNDDGNYDIEIVGESQVISVFTDYAFNTTSSDAKLDKSLEVAALLNIVSGEAFTVDGAEYKVDKESGELTNADGTAVALITNVKVVDASAQDTFDIEFKDKLRDVMTEMVANKEKSGNFTWSLKQKEATTNEDGSEVLSDKLDKNGNPIFAEEELQITELVGTYTITRNMPFFVTDKYAPMSSDHPFGTDGNGMDILARMMYGGQISLMVGFVVVIISMLIGVVLGGIAGYFGGWVDTLIMRLVEIFYCIPSYPILIILGGYMDAMRMDAEYRLYVMMAVLGILSWAGIARLVRGQILSLREQEFMVATESTGVKVRHRIFRHLVPNVMPQLIVSATGSLGGVILTESSLSFLGLGVKFPLATWGNMIEFVTGLNENLGRYIYIWLPVGILICLTVISFNFVGDGLRDAFDPKMKR